MDFRKNFEAMNFEMIFDFLRKKFFCRTLSYFILHFFVQFPRSILDSSFNIRYKKYFF